MLEELRLPGLAAVPLADLERHDPELEAVKRDRYPYRCIAGRQPPAWTRYCLAREPELSAITYVDADVFFFSSPEPLFAELGDNSIQIVPHRYAPAYWHQEETSGIYNVEWLTFRRDERATERSSGGARGVWNGATTA